MQKRLVKSFLPSFFSSLQLQTSMHSKNRFTWANEVTNAICFSSGTLIDWFLQEIPVKIAKKFQENSYFNEYAVSIFTIFLRD
jgi:hypothetical protein